MISLLTILAASVQGPGLHFSQRKPEQRRRGPEHHLLALEDSILGDITSFSIFLANFLLN
jgi:hypothetical protein